MDKEDKQQKHQHYKKDVRHIDYIDVYRIIDLYELHDPCFQHALKKILVPGARGHKDLTKDINDIIDTMQRKLEMMAENEKKKKKSVDMLYISCKMIDISNELKGE